MSGRDLVPLPALPGPGDGPPLDVEALRHALSGTGPAVRPIPPGASRPVVELGEDEDDDADPTAVGVETSGSTGDPKVVLLSAGALRASADATHDRLGGPGAWLLALGCDHVAGLQVVLRSLRAGTPLAVVDPGAAGDPEVFAAAAGACEGSRRYTSLVPTQLHRLLGAGGAGVRALAGFDAVLVGGAAVSDALLERAADCGVRVVTTYGMTETCGGCVYDGRPLAGVRVRVDRDSRVRLGGPVLARGYLARPGATREAFGPGADGRRELRTDDLGELAGDGTLRVLGRADDGILTGGVTVSAMAVAAALESHPAVLEAVVVGLPDAEWGEVVAAALVLRAADPAPSLAELRTWVAGGLGTGAAPRVVEAVGALPRLGPGKPDRVAVRRRLAEAPPTSAVTRHPAGRG